MMILKLKPTDRQNQNKKPPLEETNILGNSGTMIKVGKIRT